MKDVDKTLYKYFWYIWLG